MAYLSLAAAALVWGGAFVVGRALVGGADPLLVAWTRFVLASLTFAAIEVAGMVRRGAGRGAGRGGGHVSGARREAAPAAAGDGPGWPVFALLGLTGILA